MIAKTRGDGGFNGKLVVLVDSDSASAAEVLARVVQLEKRGVVLGDRTSGKVMRSRFYQHEMGVDTVIVYGASVTDADIIMSDGISLEAAGVTRICCFCLVAPIYALIRTPFFRRRLAAGRKIGSR